MRIGHFFKHVKLRYVSLFWAIGIVGFLTIHFAVGQDISRKEWVQEQIDKAGVHYRNGDYQTAIDLIDSALVTLSKNTLPDEKPDEHVQVLRKRLAVRRAMAQVKNGELTDASKKLETEVSKLDETIPFEEAAELRELYASSLYYESWLARLEGEDRTSWEPLADLARQQFTYLYTQDAQKRPGDKRNVEAATRLMRMDLEALKGLPLPQEVKNGQKQGQGKNGRRGEKRGQGSGKGKTPSQPQTGEDAGMGDVPVLQGS